MGRIRFILSSFHETATSAADKLSESADQAADRLENGAEAGGEAVGQGVESGLKFGGQALLAILLWWAAWMSGIAAFLLTVAAVVRMTQKKPAKGLWTASFILIGLTLLLVFLYGAANPIKG